jgi:hypothetical protein
VVSTAHPAPSISIPLTIEGNTSLYDSPVPLEPACDFPSEFLAHGTPYSDDQWAGPSYSTQAGSDVDAQVPAIASLPYPYEGPQASSSAAVQSQPHLNPNNMSVPEAQGLAPIDWPAPPHSSEAEQQQPTSHNYTESIDSRDDFPDANAKPMSSGSSDEMSDSERTRTLNLNGTRVPVQALMAEAVGDPYVHGFVKCVLVGDLHAYF